MQEHFQINYSPDKGGHMLEAGTKAPDFTLNDKDGNGIIEKVYPKAKPDTNAAEILAYLHENYQNP